MESGEDWSNKKTLRVQITPPVAWTQPIPEVMRHYEALLREREKELEELARLEEAAKLLSIEVATKRMYYRSNEQKSKQRHDLQLREALRQIELVEQEIVRRANKSIESQQRGRVQINKMRIKLAERKRENQHIMEVVLNYKAMLNPSPLPSDS